MISPWSLFLLISLQNRSTLDAFVPELNVFSLSGCGLGCAVCLKWDQAEKFGFYIPIAL